MPRDEQDRGTNPIRVVDGRQRTVRLSDRLGCITHTSAQGFEARGSVCTRRQDVRAQVRHCLERDDGFQAIRHGGDPQARHSASRMANDSQAARVNSRQTAEEVQSIEAVLVIRAHVHTPVRGREHDDASHCQGLGKKLQAIDLT